MQEINNNCFGSKKRNTTSGETKIGKYELRKISINALLIFFVIGGYLISTDERSCYDLSAQNN